MFPPVDRSRFFSTENRLLRRPAGIAVASESTLGVDYILRVCALRRSGRIGIILVEQGKYYIAADPADPWGSKEPISHEALRGMIDSIEAEEVRRTA